MTTTTIAPDRLARARAFLAEFERGKGSRKQLEAWREIEWRRCAEDPLYFLDKYAYIVDAGSIVKMEMWPIQRELVEKLWELKRRAQRTRRSGGICGVKSRQLGVTTVFALFDFWDCMFHDATKWDLFSHSEDKGRDIVDRVQATKDRLPKWLVERAQRRQTAAEESVQRGRKQDALTKFTFGLSVMKVMSSTFKNIQGASSNINLDEFTLHEDKKRKLRQMFATIDGACGVATVIANGDGEDDFFHFYQACKRGENGFLAYFFPWMDAPHRLRDAYLEFADGRIVRAEQVEGTDWWQFPGYTRTQVMQYAEEGKLHAPWYDEMRKKYLIENPEADDFAFRAVYPTTEKEAFYISGNARFGLATIHGLLDAEHDRRARLNLGTEEFYPPPCFLERAGSTFIRNRNHMGKWRIYAEPAKDAKYVVGGDPSGGKQSGDFGALQVLRVIETPMAEGIKAEMAAEQVAVYQHRTEPIDLATEALNAAEWYNGAFMVPETNSHISFVDAMRANYSHFYMRKRVGEKFTDASTDNIGFWSDVKSKKRVVDQLAAWLNAGWIIVHDLPTLQELLHYEIRETASGNEVTQAPKGMNDDLVTGLYLAVEGVVDLLTYTTSTDVRILLPWE